MKKRTFTDEEVQKVIYNYTVLKMGQKRAGAEFHMNDRIVKRLLQENNIPIKSLQETNVSKYSLDLSFFRQESHEFAYFLGLVSSDGCIASQENCIYIELQQQDGELLERLNQIIGNARPVKYYQTNRGYKNAKLYFYSKEVKEILKTYNIIPNKTYDNQFNFPYKLNQAFWIDYIRGYFDGDGCIKKTGASLTFQLDGLKKEIFETIQKFLFEAYNIKTTLTYNLKESNLKLWRLYCYGSEAAKIFSLLYENSTIHLKRKYNKYLLLKK